MHIDGNKKFDNRSIDQRIRDGSVSRREYQDYLANLPDAYGKAYDPKDQAKEAGRRGKQGGKAR
jgi:hypothetical protein